jgi:hypothetical protein
MIAVGKLSSLESMLAGDHDRLDRAFQTIVTRVYGGDFQQIEAEWSRFQDALVGHLDAEEKHLIPALAEDRPGEARTLLDEHTPHVARRIKRLFRQRQKLQAAIQRWMELARAVGPAAADLVAKVEQAWKDHISAQAEMHRQRAAQRLTPEREALASRLLEEWADIAMQLEKLMRVISPARDWGHWNASSTSLVSELKQVEQQIGKLPPEPVRAVDRHERRTEEDRLHLELRRRGADLPAMSYRPDGRGRYHRAFHRRSVAK